MTAHGTRYNRFMDKRRAGLWSGFFLFACTLSPGHASEETYPAGAGKHPDSEVADITNTPSTSQETFYVYQDRGSPQNHFIPSGWMGDYEDIVLDEANTESPRSGKTCIKIKYSAEARQGAQWAAVIWQASLKNWGDKPSAYSLSGMKRLTFWAKGAHGGEKIAQFRVGGLEGPSPDSDMVTSDPVMLTSQWRQYSLPLEGRDLSRVVGGFCWSISKADNPQGAVFYLDDIRYER